MNVVVVAPVTPFAGGPARHLASALARALHEAGHQVETISFPHRPADEGTSLRALVVAQQWRLPEADAVISLGFPASALAHPRHVLWLPASSPTVADSGDRAGDRAIAAAMEERSVRDARRVFRTTPSLPEAYGPIIVPVLEVPDLSESASWAVTVEALLA